MFVLVHELWFSIVNLFLIFSVCVVSRLIYLLAAAYCGVAVLATFAAQDADAARQGNSAHCTYARRPKINGFSAATVR